ncbi:hypothetical protein B296_00042308, partial [Ensete ventricosum]
RSRRTTSRTSVVEWLSLKLLSVDVRVASRCEEQAPGFGENRKPSLQDLATLTGGSMRIFSYSILLCSDGL